MELYLVGRELLGLYGLCGSFFHQLPQEISSGAKKKSQTIN